MVHLLMKELEWRIGPSGFTKAAVLTFEPFYTGYRSNGLT
jgi:hypothetical protein